MPDVPLRELDPSEMRDYDEHGAIRARGLFPEVWVERMAAAVDEAVANPTPYGEAVSLKDRGFSGDLFLWKERDAFRDFVHDSPAARIARQVLRSQRVNFFYDQLFVKPPGCHVPTPWHQDVTFWPIAGEQVCSIWLTFDEVTRETSGLEFVRGSHRWPDRFKAVTPDYNAYMLDSDLTDPPDVDAHREDYDLVGWDMQPGDALIFNGLVLHGSSSNFSTERTRRAFSSRWAGDDVRFDPRPATMPLLWRHGLSPGDPLGGPLFPQILPHAIPGEGERRLRGPEAPDPELAMQAARAVQQAQRRADATPGTAGGARRP